MKETCKDCMYFRAHYVRRGRNWYLRTSCGHCVYPRLKHRQEDTPACTHFKQQIEENVQEA